MMKLYVLPIISFRKYTRHYKYTSLYSVGNKKAGQKTGRNTNELSGRGGHNESNSKIMMIADLL